MKYDTKHAIWSSFKSNVVQNILPRMCGSHKKAAKLMPTLEAVMYYFWYNKAYTTGAGYEAPVFVGATARRQGCHRTTIGRHLIELRKLGLIKFRGQVGDRFSGWGPSIYAVGDNLLGFYNNFMSRWGKYLRACSKSASFTPSKSYTHIWYWSNYTRIFKKRVDKDPPLPQMMKA